MPTLSSGRAVGIGPSIYSQLGKDASSDMSVLLAIQFRQYMHSRADLLAACAVLLVEGIDGPSPRFTNAGCRVGQLLSGETDSVAALLRDDAIATSDGGGKAKAALKTVVGRSRVAAFAVGLAKRAAPDVETFFTTLNGQLEEMRADLMD